MALAQVTADAHYPTDTIGGFCAAMAAVPATAWLVERVPAATGLIPPG
jgi:membrane-associated phospholipid phosphatase